MVFTINRDQNDNIEQYKARLVVKGCAQKKEFDYNETFAPVVHIITIIRNLFSIINRENTYAIQLDVKNAFLHGYINEEMKLPLGFVKGKIICRLKISLYDLKQAPRAWNEKNVYIFD